MWIFATLMYSYSQNYKLLYQKDIIDLLIPSVQSNLLLVQELDTLLKH